MASVSQFYFVRLSNGVASIDRKVVGATDGTVCCSESFLEKPVLNAVEYVASGNTSYPGADFP